MKYVPNFVNTHDAIMRMGWQPKNIYNIWQRTVGPLAPMYSFHRTTNSTYQNQMFSKKHLRGYWGGLLHSEKHFKRWYLPANLPTIAPGKHSAPTLNATAASVTRYSRPGQDGGRRAIEQAELSRYHGSQAPLGPFMFRELERRLDHVIFRGGFVKDLKTAKTLIRNKQVRLNGNIETQQQIRMLPGDFIEINPDAVPWLRAPSPKQVALAHHSSHGSRYNIKEGYHTILREVVGIQDVRLIRALIKNGGDNAHAAVAKILAEGAKDGGEGGEERAKETAERAMRVQRELEKMSEEEAMEEAIEGEEEDVEVEAERVSSDATESEGAAAAAELVEGEEEEEGEIADPKSTISSNPSLSNTFGELPPLTHALLKETILTSIAKPPTVPKPLTPTHYPALPSDPSGARDFSLPAWSGPSLFVPGYLQPNWHYCTLVYLRHPTARWNMCEIPSPFNAKGDLMKTAWEWWTSRRTRMKVYTGGLMPGGIDARARVKGRSRGPEVKRSGVSEDYY